MPAVFAYEGVGARVIGALKFRDGRRLVGPMADAMVDRLPPSSLGLDAVTWVPASRARRSGRGYDQAELLARAIARRLHAPARRYLVRHDRGGQTGRTRAEREESIDLRARRSVLPRVLVVDDVCTTGASLRAARLALEDGGAAAVTTVVAARTP